MANKSRLITHLIYSGGNPLGRIMSIIQENRADEIYLDSLSTSEHLFEYWEEVVLNKDNLEKTNGDSYKTTYEFSKSLIDEFKKFKIPVLVSYGTKDWSASFNDFLRVEMIRNKKKNFTFYDYLGTEHNYFPLMEDNKTNYDVYNWDKVANDWLIWLDKN